MRKVEERLGIFIMPSISSSDLSHVVVPQGIPKMMSSHFSARAPLMVSSENPLLGNLILYVVCPALSSQ
jgi:hypothetical protein